VLLFLVQKLRVGEPSSGAGSVLLVSRAGKPRGCVLQAGTRNRIACPIRARRDGRASVIRPASCATSRSSARKVRAGRLRPRRRGLPLTSLRLRVARTASDSEQLGQHGIVEHLAPRVAPQRLRIPMPRHVHDLRGECHARSRGPCRAAGPGWRGSGSRRRRFHYGRYFRTFAGTPPAIAKAGTECATTAPAAITAPSPIVTPGSTTAFAPSQTPRPMRTSDSTQG
jgi:hypothetical protein